MNILYEDNHIIVAQKPQNLPTQADSSGDMDFLTQIKAYVKQKYDKPGDVYIGLVHRLDRPTGGVMVFARTSKAAARLSAQIKNGDFQKSYLAVVGGCPKDAVLKDYLYKNTQTNISKIVEQGTDGAKYAELSFENLQSTGGLSLLRVQLKTGRSHQIRVQLAGISTAVVGDVKYGSIKADNLCLWANELSFIHPTKKERLTFLCPPPDCAPWNYFSILKNQHTEGQCHP